MAEALEVEIASVPALEAGAVPGAKKSATTASPVVKVAKERKKQTIMAWTQ